MSSTLHHIVFCSIVQTEPTDDELVKLLRKARAYAAEHHITGLLLYYSGQFVAVLEGPADVVRPLYARILLDARHRNVLLLSNGPADCRSFSDWRMGFVAGLPAEQQARLVGYFNPESPVFLRHHTPGANPYLLTMLRDFVAMKPDESLVYRSA